MSRRDEETDPKRPGRTPGRDASLVVGDILNGIYEVRQFIARGGMGEVFEAVNVETDERVAIKAIRSHLASDPQIIALFRKEARVLTQIAHPAIVHYRVFARDPVLGLHYIVTDFIDGATLTSCFDGRQPAVGSVIALARRLASGLEAAHDRGAVHRDMSPDNVLLPERSIEHAKIIDFGIAKSLDIATETVVGDGFAGKLGYVAPEQFGDFDRQIGPWTDIYSTALVLLAYAGGKAPAMGRSLSEAVERRRAGPDLSGLPPVLARLFTPMLVPDPVIRLRSMRSVQDLLGAIRLPTDMPVQLASPTDREHTQYVAEGRVPDSALTTGQAFAPAPEPAASEPAIGAPGKADDPPAPVSARPANTSASSSRRTFVYGGLLVAALGLGAAIALQPSGVAAGDPKIAAMGRTPAVAAIPTAGERASRLSSAFAEIPCTWIAARATTENKPVALAGGSGEMRQVEAQLRSQAADIGFTESEHILRANAEQCGVIDAMRPFRAADAGIGATFLSFVPGDVVPMGRTSPCSFQPGRSVDVSLSGIDRNSNFALILLEPDGRLRQLASSRAEFNALARQEAGRFNVGPEGAFHAQACGMQPGPTAVFLLQSRYPVELGLRTGIAALPPSDFAERLADAANRAQLRIMAEWAWIDMAPQSGDIAASVDDGADLERRPREEPVTIAMVPPVALANQGERTREEARDNTAEANRRERDRVKALVDRRRGSRADAAVCQRYDGAWKNVAASSRGECLDRTIRARCKVTFAMYKERLMRRVGDRIEEQRGPRWRKIATTPAC